MLRSRVIKDGNWMLLAHHARLPESRCQPSRVSKVSQVLLPCDSVANDVEQQWFTLEQAAQYLHVGKGTVYKWIRDGYLAYYEFPSGRGRRLKREDLDGLLTRRGGEKAAAEPESGG
jgi:excisionase family DNA binding protein